MTNKFSSNVLLLMLGSHRESHCFEMFEMFEMVFNVGCILESLWTVLTYYYLDSTPRGSGLIDLR